MATGVVSVSVQLHAEWAHKLKLVVVSVATVSVRLRKLVRVAGKIHHARKIALNVNHVWQKMKMASLNRELLANGVNGPIVQFHVDQVVLKPELDVASVVTVRSRLKKQLVASVSKLFRVLHSAMGCLYPVPLNVKNVNHVKQLTLELVKPILVFMVNGALLGLVQLVVDLVVSKRELDVVKVAIVRNHLKRQSVVLLLLVPMDKSFGWEVLYHVVIQAWMKMAI